MNHELIDRYVAGKLSDAQAEEFETYCIANPEFAKQVEYEQLLKAGMAQAARGPTSELAPTNKAWYWKIALAASLVLALGFALYAWRSPAVVTPSVMAAVSADLPDGLHTMRLAMVRGAEGPPLLPAGRVRVEIVGLFDSGAEYSVALDRLEDGRADESIATLDAQHPSSPVTLQVLLDADRLKTGSYSLRVRKSKSSDEPLDFMFLKP